MPWGGWVPTQDSGLAVPPAVGQAGLHPRRLGLGRAWAKAEEGPGKEDETWTDGHRAHQAKTSSWGSALLQHFLRLQARWELLGPGSRKNYGFTPTFLPPGVTVLCPVMAKPELPSVRPRPLYWKRPATETTSRLLCHSPSTICATFFLSSDLA